MSTRPETVAPRSRAGSGMTSQGGSSLLSDCWYAVAWSEEVGDQPLGLTICGEEMIFLRRATGGVAALAGLCPHRFASLALGKRLPNDTIQCPYHGLEFDLDGACVGNPHGAVPRVARLRQYPTVEKHSLIWLWFGQDDRLNEELIPDFSVLEDPSFRTVRGRLKTQANYELITDNLLDLSHVGYVHAGGIGSDAVKQGRHEVVQSGTTLFSNRWCPDAPAAPVWAALFNNYEGNVDHWLNMRWDAPSTMWLDVGVAPPGQSRQRGITVYGAHILTPESEGSTHYLFAGARDFARDSDEVDVGLKASLESAFVDEDRPILEQIQTNMKGKSFGEMRPLILPFDEGAVRARRLLDDMRTKRKTQLKSVADWQGRLVPRNFDSGC